LEDCIGAAAGAGAFGQQEAARKEAAAATMASLTSFIGIGCWFGFLPAENEQAH
jgi:hypothetical protein